MKIVHIAPTAPYNDYWGYQDNLLPKYHKKMGHDVVMITTNTMHKDGKIVETDCTDYVLNDGVRIIRRSYKKRFCKLYTNLCAKIEIFDLLIELKPDFVFYHGLISKTIYDVIKYKRKCNPNMIVVQDNHMDYNIGFKYDSLKKKLKRAFYRNINKRSIKDVAKVYGVTPWRKTYAEDYFGINKNKTDVLIMGADDEKIDFLHRSEKRNEIRKKFGILDDDFLIVTGGKIDHKKRITDLMIATQAIQKAKLMIFGNVQDDVRDHFNQLLSECDNIKYIGWIDSDRVYDYFFAADLAFFPGQHSVLWEQACASKVPCVFEKWEGMDHVNNGGNSDFVSSGDEDALKKKIEELMFTDKYLAMKAKAESEATDVFLYSKIAEKSLECVK